MGAFTACCETPHTSRLVYLILSVDNWSRDQDGQFFTGCRAVLTPLEKLVFKPNLSFLLFAHFHVTNPIASCRLCNRHSRIFYSSNEQQHNNEFSLSTFCLLACKFPLSCIEVNHGNIIRHVAWEIFCVSVCYCKMYRAKCIFLKVVTIHRLNSIHFSLLYCITRVVTVQLLAYAEMEMESRSAGNVNEIYSSCIEITVFMG